MTHLVNAAAAVIMMAALAYILRFSVNMPYVDEWDLTHVVLGGMTLPEWTFTRLNEHLYIPGNALWYITMKASGLNFRAGMIVNWLLISSASIILIRAARQMRGGVSFSDLIFPAALLHFGHAYNLLMSYQIVFGCFVLAAAVLLSVIATAEAGRESRTAWRAGFALLFLMLNGGMGLAFVPAISLWIAALCWRSRATAPLIPMTLAIAYTAFVMFGAPRANAAPAEALPLGRIAWCVVQYLGIGTGLWYDGPHWPRNGIIIAACYIMAAFALIIRTIRNNDGGRNAGFLAFLLGHFAVAFGIAISRGGGIAERYVTISAIGIIALALAFSRQRGWMFAAITLVAINIAPGLSFGHGHRSLYRSFESDLRNEMPIREVRLKYQKPLRVGENLEPALERLKVNHLKPFSDLP